MNVTAFRKTAHPRHKGGVQKWERTEIADTLNAYDNTESRTPVVVVENGKEDDPGS